MAQTLTSDLVTNKLYSLDKSFLPSDPHFPYLLIKRVNQLIWKALSSCEIEHNQDPGHKLLEFAENNIRCKTTGLSTGIASFAVARSKQAIYC